MEEDKVDISVKAKNWLDKYKLNKISLDSEDSLEKHIIGSLYKKNARLKEALRELQKLGEEGMPPNYDEWLTFHDKVAQVAREALNNKE